MGKFKAISLPPTRILIDEFAVVCQGFSHPITEVTKKSSNSFDLERLERPVSLAYPAIALPSSLCHPRISDMLDDQFEGPLTENKGHHATGKELTGGRRTYIFCTMACTGVDLVRCSHSHNRHAPRRCPPRDI
jgi:hypothetical protein